MTFGQRGLSCTVAPLRLAGLSYQRVPLVNTGEHPVLLPCLWNSPLSPRILAPMAAGLTTPSGLVWSLDSGADQTPVRIS